VIQAFTRISLPSTFDNEQCSFYMKYSLRQWICINNRKEKAVHHGRQLLTLFDYFIEHA